MPVLLCPSKCQDPEISPALLWAFTATLEIGQDSNYCPHVTKEVTEAQTGEVTCPKPHSNPSFTHSLIHLASVSTLRVTLSLDLGEGGAGAFLVKGSISRTLTSLASLPTETGRTWPASVPPPAQGTPDALPLI